MQIGPAAAERINQLVQGLLDRGYTRLVQPVLRAVAAEMTGGEAGARMNDLEVEGRRLQAIGEPLATDNAVLVATIAAVAGAAARAARAVNRAAGGVQDSAVASAGRLTRELAIGGIDNRTLVRLGVRWNVPDPEAIARVVGYASSSTWGNEIRQYPDLIIDAVRRQAVRGVLQGWSPIRTAREIRRVAQSLTTAQANTLMRTLQLTSYRDAAAANQRANADILAGQIRIGTLDARICMACIALHGTSLPVGARVDDHHNGRCVGVPVVRGITLTVQTGEQWFASLSQDLQREIAGPGALELLQTGRAQLRDFAVNYDDQTFGRMIRQATLAEVRGS